jgi:antitoxin CptB
MTILDDDIARWRRQLRFRSWHRGTREMDLLLGRFADAHLEGFGREQLDLFARLLENSDPEIYDWIIGKAPVPAGSDSDILTLLRNFSLNHKRS